MPGAPEYAHGHALFAFAAVLLWWNLQKGRIDTPRMLCLPGSITFILDHLQHHVPIIIRYPPVFHMHCQPTRLCGLRDVDTTVALWMGRGSKKTYEYSSFFHFTYFVRRHSFSMHQAFFFDRVPSCISCADTVGKCLDAICQGTTSILDCFFRDNTRPQIYCLRMNPFLPP